jgi:hypothetical protein
MSVSCSGGRQAGDGSLRFTVAAVCIPGTGLLIFLAFAGVDPQKPIRGAEAHGRGHQCDGRNHQRDYPPGHLDWSRQSDYQQHDPNYDATDAVHSADIVFHDGLLMLV